MLHSQQVLKGCDYMYKIVVLSDNDERLKAALPATDDVSFSFTDKPDVSPDTDCVLVSQDYSGDSIRNIAETFRRRGIACAAVTFDNSRENEVRLLGSGVKEVIALPVDNDSFVKRITAMLSAERIASDSGFEQFAKIVALDDQRGAFVVHESNFTNLYRFVKRLLERMDKPAYLVKFTFTTPDNRKLEPGALEEAFLIVKMCLRRGDIVCIYGSSLLAILIGADAEGAKTAAQRIIDTYQAFSVDGMYEMGYETNEIK